MTYDPYEQVELLGIFRQMLEGPTADGGKKRSSGQKVPWREDEGHIPALYRHLHRWEEDGPIPDEMSGSHPLVHVAWRALAIAWRETHDHT